MRGAVVISIYAALSFLAVFLLDLWLCKCSKRYKGSVAARVVVCFLYLAVSFIPVLATIINNGPLKFELLRWSYMWLGFFMFFGAIILGMTIIDLLISIPGIARRKRESEDDREIREGRNRVVARIVFVLMIAGAIGANVYGYMHAMDTKITHYDVNIKKDVKKVKAIRVVMITDVHLVFNSNKKMIKRAVSMINDQKPDIVMVGGDLFSSSFYAVPDPKEYAEILAGIKSKYGTYFVYGNHDVEEPLFCGFALNDPDHAFRTQEMTDFVKAAEFTTLDDKVVSLASGSIQLAGRKDGEKAGDGTRNRMSAKELLKDVDKKKPVLVLEHEPVDYENLAKAGADMSFSGHTHAGQVWPGTIVTSMLNDMTYGLEDMHGMKVLVSSGLGFYGPPLRIGTNSEIVVCDITLGNK